MKRPIIHINPWHGDDDNDGLAEDRPIKSQERLDEVNALYDDESGS